MKTFNRLTSALSVLCLLSLGTASMARAENRTGTILETMNASSYTYMRLKTDTGETWAAVPQANVKVGAKVTIVDAQEMNGFESKTLKRKFDHILFGSLNDAAADEALAQETSAKNPKSHQGKTTAAAFDFAKIKMPKAKGPTARTVAEIYAQKTELKDKDVLIHGKVVKFLPGIMNKNWVHISDGSGSKDKKDFDLTVTTLSNMATGDDVVIQGKVHTDVNFGAGYFFTAIIEDAKITKD